MQDVAKRELPASTMGYEWTELTFQQIKAEPALRAVSKQLNSLWERSMAAASICQVLAQRLGWELGQPRRM